jgi:putative transposase
VSVIELSSRGEEITSAALLRTVGRSLASRVDELCRRQVEIARGFAAYEVVSDDELTTSARRNVARLVAVVGGNPHAGPPIEVDERNSGVRRALQGLDADDVAQCYRMSISALRDAFLDEASAVGVDAESVLRVTRDLWSMSDRYASELASGRTQAAACAARRQVVRSQAFLTSVQRDEFGPAELAVAAAALGVVADQPLWVLRLREPAEAHAGTMHELERCAVGGMAAPLIAKIGADVLAVASRSPDERLLAGAVVVLGPRPLTGLRVALAESARLLDVATRFGLSGVIDRERVGVLLAIADHAEVTDTLLTKYVVRVEQEGGGTGTILLDTVESFLEHNRGMKRTSKALHIHVNTLRHRLQRYEEVVGESLCDTRVVVEVWWALLQRRRTSMPMCALQEISGPGRPVSTPPRARHRPAQSAFG